MAGHVLAARHLFQSSHFNWLVALLRNLDHCINRHPGTGSSYYGTSFVESCTSITHQTGSKSSLQVPRALVYLFYFNRLIASIISFAIRSYTWHYYRVHIDIKALQISLLAGRLFLKGVHYHGENETIVIQDGYITWRYWLRRIEELDLDDFKANPSSQKTGLDGKERTSTNTDQESAGAKALRRDLPSRVLVKARGVQWFIYNRSPAYDAIFARLNEVQTSQNVNALSGDQQPLNGQNGPTLSKNVSNVGDSLAKENSSSTKLSNDGNERDFGFTPTRQSTESSNDEDYSQKASLPGLLGILPIKIECNKGAVVMGNQNTCSILTATFESATGCITARAARPLDQYKQVMDFMFTHPIIQFKHNKEYQCPQIEKGRKLNSKINHHDAQPLHWYERLYFRQRIVKIISNIRYLVPNHQDTGSVESFSQHRQTPKGPPEITRNDSDSYGPNRWIGLSRYLDDSDATIEQERWKAIEYARFPTIVDSPSISMSLYWDVPGEVQTPTESFRHEQSHYKNDINGDVPPDWGIDLRVRGGTINYGPWADRQRADLQTVFFPPIHMDALAGKPLNLGETRVSTELKMSIIIEEQTTLRIPTREDSKDWKWKGRIPPSNKKDPKTKKSKSGKKGHKSQRVDSDPQSRPFGWLDIDIFPDSTVSFTMDLVAKNDGYKNLVNLDLKGIELSSSVNHAVLLRSKSQLISLDMGFPIAWNTLRRWNIDSHAESIEVFLLRDHIFLITDLVNDWSSGPPAEFHTFVPFIYALSIQFRDFKVYFNANDSNVIDNPAAIEDNTFIVIWGQELIADLTIPMDNFRPAKNTVSFDIEARDGGFELLTQPWNTQHTFLESPHVAGLKDLKIDGSYNYHASTSPALTDTLQLDIHALSLKVALYGFLIRYLMKIKDNYFGDDIHFRTVEEYQQLITQPHDNTVKSEQRGRLSNDLDVIIGIAVEDSFAQLPSQLYSAVEGVTLEISTLQVDLRVTNYYMDLAITSSPIGISKASRPTNSPLDFGKGSATQLSLNSMQVYGHRLFGLPPTEPTYVCNWDFDIGQIEGDCSMHFLHNLSQAINCFGLTFPDAENAVPSRHVSQIHDVTFLRARLQPISIGMRIEQTALLLESDDISIKFNDWAGSRFSDHFSAVLPRIILSLVDSTGIMSSDTVNSNLVKTYACLQTALDVRSVSRKPAFEEDREHQQRHILLQDSRTQRTPWLIRPSTYLQHQSTAMPPAKTRPPAMDFPAMPAPFSSIGVSRSRPSSVSSVKTASMESLRRPRRKSSFLSASSITKKSKNQGRGTRIKPVMEESRTAYRADGNAVVSESSDNTIEQRRSISTSKDRPKSRFPGLNSQRTSSHLGFAFTSPYKKPYFPVLALRPDTARLPEMPPIFPSDNVNEDISPDEIVDELHPDSSQSSLMLDFNRGILFYCTPRALFVATKLQEGFQAREPEALLDSLQIDAMSQLVRDGASRDKGSNVRNFRINLPFVELKFVNDVSTTSSISTRQERYELSLENFAASIRLSDLVSQDATPQIDHQMSVHMTFNRLECSAREYTEGHKHDQAVIGLSLLQPVFWINKAAALSGDLQFKDIEIVSASRKVDHISSLVRQTMFLVEALTHRFARASSSQASRLGLLILLLTKQGEDIPDPSFLSGASYVLRSAVNHLRSSDSWKMMSRLRHVFRELPTQSREEIRRHCAERFVSCPPDGGAYVVKTFNHWRTWDLAHVRSSVLMQKAFGDLLLSPAERMSQVGPSKLSFKAGRFRLLIDPGPHQNEVVFTRVFVNTALFQEGKPLAESPESEAARPTESIVEVYLAQMALRLNWALCELVESIVRTIQDAADQENTEAESLAHPTASVTPNENTNWHVVLCVGLAIANLDTLALKVIALCQGLRSSIVFMGRSNADIGGLVSMAICADAATSEVRSLTKALTFYKLQRPSVVGSRDGCIETGNERPWRFVGSGKEISFEVLASLLEILEVADDFVQNEVNVVFSWLQSIQSRSSRSKDSPPDKSTARPGLPKAHVTLFLDAYFISLAILPTLVYQIHGTGGRTSIKSNLRGEFQVDFDVDIRDHSHTFRGGLEQDALEISTLLIPPINGRLALDLAPQQKSVVLRALAEPIMLEASAIHSMISAINRPEIVNIVKGTSDQIKLIQLHVPQTPDLKISDPVTVREDLKAVRPLLYDAYITLAGFAIHAGTPDARSENSAAKLEFNMGRIQLKAANNDLGRWETFKLPEIEARLDLIRLRLIRTKVRQSIPCGEVVVAVVLRRTSKVNGLGKIVPAYQIQISNPKVNIYTETASVIVAIAGHLQDTLRTIEVSEEVKNLGRLGYARLRSESAKSPEVEPVQIDRDPISEALMNAMYSLELTNILVVWNVENFASKTPDRPVENLVLSFTKINLATKRENAARLTIQDFQLQMVPHSAAPVVRSANSALLPEVIFNVAYLSTAHDRRFAYQAKGKALDLRLTSQLIFPASHIRRSIAVATDQVRAATESWYATTPETPSKKRMNPLNSKKLGSVLVDADFAGAVVYIQGRSAPDSQAVALNPLRIGRLPQHGRYNQFTPDDTASHATLRAPGFAFKAEYKSRDVAEPYLNAEVKVEASSNTLYPTVVPLIMEISSSIKEIVSESDRPEGQRPTKDLRNTQPSFFGEERLRNPDPAAIFGDVRLNFGLRICRQEFSLSCQPIARVAATAYFDDIYITVNTVRSENFGKFFSVSATVSRLKANLQHVYSRESTCGFQVDSIVLSLMNSRHVSKTHGISAILKLSPTIVQINAKQSQDFLLFREIWVPREIRQSSTDTELTPTTEPQAFIVQRYQQVAAAGAFPWNATISVEQLDVRLDLGQSLGKSSFIISHFWVASRKSSDWEQNMCLGFDKASVDGTGRTSGSVELTDFKVRTSIQWPIVEDAHNQTPLIQASLGFDQLCVKAGFDYQPFIIANVKSFEFLMYNVRDAEHSARDRLVGILDAHQLQVYLTTTSASQAIALAQAVQKLIQEKQTAYEMSLKDIEKYLRRKSSVMPFSLRPATPKVQSDAHIEVATTSLKLQTDVVVTLKTVNIGAFPSTFFDQQIFKVEALDASARFAVVLENERVHSTLGLILGQLRIALSGVSQPSVPKTLGDVMVKDVVDAAMGSRGGTILKVPKLIATMQTWQSPESTAIDYIFKSSFQGKVDVGWNYSRISYIRGMYNVHERALAQRLGKEMPQPAVQITGLEDESEGGKVPGSGHEKITAVVNVPQSKYQYTALQPPIIETPQLRDMGEATPPLEWIGLHRDRLPNLTHQIVIVTLLQLAGEVDEAYNRILGSS